jgi:hypothetical protein
MRAGEQRHHGSRRGQREEQREDAEQSVAVRRQEHEQPEDCQQATAQDDSGRLPETWPDELRHL